MSRCADRLCLRCKVGSSDYKVNMKKETIGYKVMINSNFYLPGQSRKREPVVVVKSEKEAYTIAFRLNGRSRPEELYKVEKIVA